MNKLTLMAMIYILWAGEIIGLSFIATPAKFLASNFTIPELLIIGNVTFHTQKWVEWGFLAVLLILNICHYRKNGINNNMAVLITIFCLFMIEYYYLMPIMDIRLSNVVNGINQPATNHHNVFVALEIIKIIILVVCSYKIIKNKSTNC
ncbi:MAG: hypothetical protein ACPG8V_02345 [Alphaproteobacteria bacterium]